MASDLDALFSKPVPKAQGRSKRLPQFKSVHKPLIGADLLNAEQQAKNTRKPICVCGDPGCWIGPFLG